MIAAPTTGALAVVLNNRPYRCSTPAAVSSTPTTLRLAAAAKLPRRLLPDRLTRSHHTVAAQTGTTVINQHTLGSLVIDFGSLSRALGFGNGSIVSLGSTGSG